MQVDTEFIALRAGPLASMLGVSVPTALGCCVLVWHYGMERGGTVEGPRAAQIIEGIARWQKKRGELVAAMLDLDLLLPLEEGPGFFIAGSERYDLIRQDMREAKAAQRAAASSPPRVTPQGGVIAPFPKSRNGSALRGVSRKTSTTLDARREMKLLRDDLDPDLSTSNLSGRKASSREREKHPRCESCGETDCVPHKRGCVPRPGPTSDRAPSEEITLEAWREATQASAPPTLVDQWERVRCLLADLRLTDEQALALWHSTARLEPVALDGSRARLEFWESHDALAPADLEALSSYLLEVEGPALTLEVYQSRVGVEAQERQRRRYRDELEARERSEKLERERADQLEHARQAIVDVPTFRLAWSLLCDELGRDAGDWQGRVSNKARELLDEKLHLGSEAIFDAAAEFLTLKRFGPDWPIEIFLSGGPSDWRVAGFRIENAAAEASRRSTVRSA